MEKLVQKSAQILSELTNYTAILLGPAVKENKLKRLQIVPLNQETAVAIIITDTGHVENRMFTLPHGFNLGDLEKLVNILNAKLADVPINELRDKIYKEVVQILRAHIENYDAMLHSISDTLNVHQHEKIFFGGKSNILNQPEFNDIHKIRSLMEMIEGEKGVYELFKHTPAGIHVKIGKENQLSEMEDCSVITATYSIGQESVGTIALLGPIRMEYSRVISIVDFLSHDMSRALTRLYQG
jgi:heat-inducible transcriptional repressor